MNKSRELLVVSAATPATPMQGILPLEFVAETAAPREKMQAAIFEAADKLWAEIKAGRED